MPIVQDPLGQPLLGVDAIPTERDAVLIFEAFNPDLSGRPLYVHSGANSIKWSYELNTQVTPTVGGSVIQILSCFVGPIRIEGLTAGKLFDQDDLGQNIYDSRAGWTNQSYTPVDEMMQIIDWFLTYMQWAGTTVRNNSFRDERAIRFQYPARGWDFYIMVTDLEGFEIRKDQTAVPWAITAEIVSENALDYFSGQTMASFTQPLNNSILQNAITPGWEFANNPFINPQLPQNDPTKAAKNLGDNFQGLIAAWTTGDFNTWGFSSLGAIADANYNDKALSPLGNYHVTGGMADYWTQKLGGYWVGGGRSLSDYRVSGDDWSGPGSSPGGPGGNPGGGPGGSGGGTDQCGDSDCWLKKAPTILDPGALAKAIDKWISDHRADSPLIGQGNLIVSEANKYGLNPLVFPVVALIESTLGTDCCHHDNSNFNTWGDLIGGTGGACVVFSSYEDATIKYFANLATNSAYTNDTTLCQIVNSSAPPDVNPDYQSKFQKYFPEILMYAGKSIVCKSTAPPPDTCSGLGQKVSGLAKQYVGKNLQYKEGDRCWWPPKPLPWTPDSDSCGGHFDCSSFCSSMYTLAGCGIFDSGSDTHSMIQQGTHIDRKDIQPGDLVFYDTPAGVNNHVGVYVGDNKIVDMGHSGGAFSNPLDLGTGYSINDIRRYCKECGVDNPPPGKDGWLTSACGVQIQKSPVTEFGPHGQDGEAGYPISGVRGVLHDTEGGSFEGNTSFMHTSAAFPPHFVIGVDQNGKPAISQQWPLGVSASAVIGHDAEIRMQIEITAPSGASSWSKAEWRSHLAPIKCALKSLMGQAGVPMVYKGNPSQRGQNWSQSGWFGHMDVPDNDHGDPGAGFPWEDYVQT